MVSILQLVQQAAARSPEHTAVICGDERLSYRQLLERVDILARYLRTQFGVSQESLVCVAVDPSPCVPVAMLAVLAAGAAYVPLDPTYPAARLRDMLDQVGRCVVLGTSSALQALPARAGRFVELDREWSSIAATRGDAVASAASADSLAYVIFTSGSTGKPKGVMVPHRGLANLALAQIAEFEIEARSVVLQFAPLSFDASVSEVFTALVAGATLCLAPRDELAPGPRLVELVRKYGVTIITLPPSSLALLDPTDFPSLRTVVSAGEACSAAQVLRWSRSARFVNAYGPTEATVCATMAVCRPDPQGPSLGEPLPNATVALYAPELRPTTAGEIYIGGVGLARGYLARPDLTAERFVPSPEEPGARMYRTGDLARRRADGSLEFLGRADDQVKVRGHRVELGEIDAVMRAAPNVRDALVVAREEETGDVRLIAYLIGPRDVAAVRAAAASRLPDFARPTDYVVLDDWPRGPTGKIDRARLPAPVRKGSSAPARSEVELRLIELWETVLGTTGVGPNDDFFEIGGHSLLAIRLLSRIRAEFGVDLPASIMSERRTVAAQAELLAARGQRVTVKSPLLLQRAGAQRPLFLVPPVSGSALVYLPLVRRMTAERPIYAFHAPGLDGSGPVYERLEDLAAHYVRELVAVQPEGPFLLAGWSLGGALAFEMAGQLAQRGHDVPRLLVIDASAPNKFLATMAQERLGPLSDETLAYMFVKNFGRCFDIELPIEREHFVGIPPGEVAQAALVELRRVPAFAPDIDVERLRRQMAVFRATLRGFVDWQPQCRYTGQFVHFVGTAGHPEFEAARMDWSEFLAQPARCIDVPGTHFSVVNEPHVAVLGPALDSVLDEVA